MKKIPLICILFGLLGYSLNAQSILISGALTNPLCAGEASGAISLTVTGGQPPYTFNWSIGASSQDISGLASGTYSVTVTDAFGETATEFFTLIDPLELNSAATNISAISCFGGSDGALSIIASGGTPPYGYAWSNGATTADLNNLAQGNYIVTVTDVNGCSVELNLFMSEPTEIVADSRVYNCESASGADGQATINTTGGTPPYTFFWSDGTNTPNALRNDLSYGGYDITIEDASGCTQVLEDLYICNETMQLPPDMILCQFDEVELEAFAPNAVAYDWAPSSSLSCIDCPNPIANPTVTTTYTLTITSPGLSEFVHEVTITIDGNCVWPGDIDSSGLVSHFDLLPIGLSYGTEGPERYKASGNWEGQTALPWGNTVPSTTIDLRHVDADGNGSIEAADADALRNNWEQNLAFSNEGSPYPNIPLLDTLPFYIEVDTFHEGQRLELPVILGIEDLPGEEIYGIAFSIDYDSSLFVPGTAEMIFDNSWLGTEGVDMITVQKEFSLPGRLDVAMVRTDGVNTSGSGPIGSYIIVVEDDILLHQQQGSSSLVSAENLETLFRISDVRLLNKEGLQMDPYTPIQTGILSEQAVATRDLLQADEAITLFPNPAQEELVLQAPAANIHLLEIYTAAGILVVRRTWRGIQRARLDLSALPNGTYWVSVQTDLGVVARKLVVLK